MRKVASTVSLGVSADLHASYERLKAELITDLHPEDLENYRQRAASRAPDPDAMSRAFDVDSADERVEGVNVTRLWSRNAPAEHRVGIIVFLHGGGLIAGNRYDGLDVVLEPASRLNAEVWTVEYGLAPTTTFDFAVLEALRVVDAAFCANRGPVVVAGQSAGGGLAAAVALLDRDRTGGRLAGQLLICPMLSDRGDTSSMRQFESDPLWSRISNLTAWRAALGEGVQSSGIAPPAHEADLAGLPPTYLDSGTAEVFRDDIAAHALRLWAAGVPTELHVWEGGYHGFDGADPTADVSRQARAARAMWLTRLFTGGLASSV